MQAARARGAVNAWIHPRRRGLTARMAPPAASLTASVTVPMAPDDSDWIFSGVRFPR